ncbi:unnamed protein product [Alternaria alternata]
MPVRPPPYEDDASNRTHQRHAQGRVGLQKVNVACHRCRVKKIKCMTTYPSAVQVILSILHLLK